MARLAWLIVALAALAACRESQAPQDAGVCWRYRLDDMGRPQFRPLARGVPSLENCAVLLEAEHLRGDSVADGAYQGAFIFVDGGGIRSGERPDSFRYPVFQPPQRAAIDRDLRAIMKSHGGRLPDAAEITLERR